MIMITVVSKDGKLTSYSDCDEEKGIPYCTVQGNNVTFGFGITP